MDLKEYRTRSCRVEYIAKMSTRPEINFDLCKEQDRAGQEGDDDDDDEEEEEEDREIKEAYLFSDFYAMISRSNQSAKEMLAKWSPKRNSSIFHSLLRKFDQQQEAGFKKNPRSLNIEKPTSPLSSWIQITLSEGRNRQVRKMTAAVGHPTLRLIRVSLGNYSLYSFDKRDLGCEFRWKLAPGAFDFVNKNQILEKKHINK